MGQNHRGTRTKSRTTGGLMGMGIWASGVAITGLGDDTDLRSKCATEGKAQEDDCF